MRELDVETEPVVDEMMPSNDLAVAQPRLYRRLLASDYVRHNILVLGASILTGICNYLVHPLLVRLLGLSSYAAVASLLSLSAVLLVPTQVIGTVVARYASMLSAVGQFAQLHDLVRRLLAILLPVGIGVAVIFMALSGPIANFLHLVAVAPVLLMGLSFVAAFVGPVNSGVLQGLQRFSWFAPLTVLPLILRLVLTGLLVALGLGVNGAILATVLGGLLAYGVSFQPLRPLLGGPRADSGSLRPLFAYSLTAVLAVASNTLLFNIDIILARHFLPGNQAGLYTVLATLGRTVLFVSSSVATVMFPKAAGLHHRGESTTRVVLQSVLCMMALSALVEIVFIIAPAKIIAILFTPQAVGVADQLAWYGLAMLMLAPGQALIAYFLAVNDRLFALSVMACCALQAFLIVIRHQTVGELVQAAIAANVLLFAALLVQFAIRARKNRPERLDGAKPV